MNGPADEPGRAGAPRLPQIDPITFSALNTLDGFLARAALTRQEHAEANRTLQHIVQTIEALQAELRERQMQNGEPQMKPATGAAGGNAAVPLEGSTVGAGLAEEIFRSGRRKTQG